MSGLSRNNAAAPGVNLLRPYTSSAVRPQARYGIITALRGAGSMNTERGRRQAAALAATLALAAVGATRSAPPTPPHVHLLATGGTISGGQQPLDAAGNSIPPGIPDQRAFCGGCRTGRDSRHAWHGYARGNGISGRSPRQGRAARRVRGSSAASSRNRHRRSAKPAECFPHRCFAIRSRRGGHGDAQRRNSCGAGRRKTHAIAVEAFQSPWAGPLGYVDGSRVVLKRRPAVRVTIPAAAIEPKVDLITLTAGSDGHRIQGAVDSGAKGLVVEGFGRGNVPPAVMDAVKAARARGVAVVFTTRTRGGRVEIDETAHGIGVISGGALDGLKARMLLIAALGAKADGATIQKWIDQL